MKIRTSSLIVAVALVGCNDNHPQQQYQQPYQQPMAQYQQPVQPQVVQPQVIQAPAAPVVVQQQHDNTLTNMALGAVIGHTIANMGNNESHSTERVVEHKTVIIDNRQSPSTVVPVSSAPVSAIAPAAPAPVSTPTPAPVAQPKTSAMDMDKLSASAKQTFNTASAAPVSTPSPSRPGAMDMSRLNSSRPPVSLAKPTASRMDMSKLGRK